MKYEHPSSGSFRSAADDEDTSPDIPLLSMPPLPDDVHEALGVLMAATARTGRHVRIIKRQYGALRAELVAMRKDLEGDRKKLVQASANRSSNRMAALLGSLFTLYELASPYLHEILKMGHQ